MHHDGQICIRAMPILISDTPDPALTRGADGLYSATPTRTCSRSVLYCTALPSPAKPCKATTLQATPQCLLTPQTGMIRPVDFVRTPGSRMK